MSDTESDTDLEEYAPVQDNNWGRKFRKTAKFERFDVSFDGDDLPEEYRLKQRKSGNVKPKTTIVQQQQQHKPIEPPKCIEEKMDRIVDLGECDIIKLDNGVHYQTVKNCDGDNERNLYVEYELTPEQAMKMVEDIHEKLYNASDADAEYLPSPPHNELMKLDKIGEPFVFQCTLRIYIGFSGNVIKSLFTYNAFDRGMYDDLISKLSLKMNTKKPFTLSFFCEPTRKYGINNDADFVSAMFVHGVFLENQYTKTCEVVLYLEFDDLAEEKRVARFMNSRIFNGTMNENLFVRLHEEPDCFGIRKTFLPDGVVFLGTWNRVTTALFDFYEIKLFKCEKKNGEKCEQHDAEEPETHEVVQSPGKIFDEVIQIMDCQKLFDEHLKVHTGEVPIPPKMESPEVVVPQVKSPIVESPKVPSPKQQQPHQHSNIKGKPADEDVCLCNDKDCPDKKKKSFAQRRQQKRDQAKKTRDILLKKLEAKNVENGEASSSTMPPPNVPVRPAPRPPQGHVLNGTLPSSSSNAQMPDQSVEADKITMEQVQAKCQAVLEKKRLIDSKIKQRMDSNQNTLHIDPIVMTSEMCTASVERAVLGIKNDLENIYNETLRESGSTTTTRVETSGVLTVHIPDTENETPPETPSRGSKWKRRRPNRGKKPVVESTAQNGSK